jgi:phosphohistidine phosphatase
MLLYLVQHAESLSKEEDPTQSLSEKGIENIKKVANYVAELDIKVHQIFHSEKLRAMQTAQILSDFMKTEKGVSETDGLSPMDDPQIWFERLHGMKEDIILVGHLPHLSKFASLLLCGDKEKSIIDFKRGGIVCLKSFEYGNWTVEWMIIPEVIK